MEAVRAAMDANQRYDLICLDILMPEMDGDETLRQIPSLEESRGILSSRGSKIL